MLPQPWLIFGARFLRMNKNCVMKIADLWHSSDSDVWALALGRYWEFVRPANLELERALDSLDLARIRGLDAQGWYDFLRSEYFRWKYTAPNRYATTTRSLAQQFAELGGRERLHDIKSRLLKIDTADVGAALAVAREIRGLGVAGASGLLSLLYPMSFGTVDQFVVKALRDVGSMPEAGTLARMNPEALTTKDGIVLISILARKATENNRMFATTRWTPRKIDQILWTCGRN